MAGTDQTRGGLPDNFPKGPAIVLVEPQLGKNIGMVARAMLNCGLTDLRLVNPRDGWPSDDALLASAGAVAVIENVKLFSSTAEAVADLKFVAATTARDRDMIKTFVTLPGLLPRLEEHGAGNCGILFGPERAGLNNEDIARADVVLSIPLNPRFSSLNLAQAVLLVAHSWYLTVAEQAPQSEYRTGQSPLATKEHVTRLENHLIDELTAAGFFTSPAKRPGMKASIRNLLTRMQWTEQDVRTFHGIIASLSGKKAWK